MSCASPNHQPVANSTKTNPTWKLPRQALERLLIINSFTYRNTDERNTQSNPNFRPCPSAPSEKSQKQFLEVREIWTEETCEGWTEGSPETKFSQTQTLRFCHIVLKTDNLFTSLTTETDENTTDAIAMWFFNRLKPDRNVLPNCCIRDACATFEVPGVEEGGPGLLCPWSEADSRAWTCRLLTITATVNRSSQQLLEPVICQCVTWEKSVSRQLHSTDLNMRIAW